MASSQPAPQSLPLPDFGPDDDGQPPKVAPTATLVAAFPIPIVTPHCGTIPQITPQTMADLIGGRYYHIFHALVIFDCRFAYEFEAGHIGGAHNLTTLEDMRKKYDEYRGQSVCFVFHCEFSKVRGPWWAATFRIFDRDLNAIEYHQHRVEYPHVFLLHGGFEAWFAAYGTVLSLTVGNYRPMEPTEPKELYQQANANYQRQTRSVASQNFRLPFAGTQQGQARWGSQPIPRLIGQPNLDLNLRSAEPTN
jgi:rhodanese-related sulfurtransferase